MKQHRQEGMVLPPVTLLTSVGRGDSQGVSVAETRPFPCGPGDNGAYLLRRIEMSIELEPLEGKYYETRISGTIGGKRFWLSVSSEDREPSDRELAECGVSRENWNNNVEVDDGWGGRCPVRSAELMDSGGHYERQLTLEIAQKIVEALSQ